MIRISCILFLFFVGLFAKASAEDILYITTLKDGKNFTITWQNAEKKDALALDKEKSQRTAISQKLDDGSYQHRVVLNDLASFQEYHFTLQASKKSYFFKTLPEIFQKGLKFVIGGDAYQFLALFKKGTEAIAKEDPAFVVVGGDIAYTQGTTRPFKGKNWELRRWQTFLKEWTASMKGKDGRLIPMTVVIGNHDVKNNRNALLFTLFDFKKKEDVYRSLDIGRFFSLILLDTGHINSVSGEQTLWLKTTLEEKRDIPMKIAAYHVAAYPSVYPYTGARPREIRDNWVPAFEEGGILACFEHHNHAYKRTHPIKKGKVDPQGIVYFGDGSWGVEAREIKNHGAWYLAKASQTNNFHVITLESEKMLTIQSMNLDSETIDTLQKITPQEPVKALVGCSK
jgi:acid phosphatase type 7